MLVSVRSRASLASLATLLAVWIVFNWPLLTPFPDQRLHIVEGDFTNQFYPYRYFTADQIHRLRPPLWNPYIFGGHPFQADPQTAVFYPPALLTAAIFGADGLPIEALELEVAAHYLLALIFSYIFFMVVIGRHVPAVGGAICFGLSGYLTSYPAQQLAILETAIWLPAVLLGIELAIRRGATAFWAALASVPVAVAFLAGHPQTLMFIIYLAIAYAIWRLRKVEVSLVRSCVFLATFGATSIGLSAIQLLPTLEFVGLSSRSELSYGESAQGYRLSSLLGMLTPAWRGENALYLGAPAILAVASLISARRPPWFWITVLIAALGLSLGGRQPLFPILHAVLPAYALFQRQERVMILAAFAAAALVAWWLASMGDRNEPITRKLVGPVLVLASVLSAWLLLPYVTARTSIGDPANAGVDLAVVVATVVVTALFLLAVRRWPRIAAATAVLLVAILFLDLIRVNYGNNLTRGQRDVIAEFSAIADFVADYPEPYRVFSEPDTFFPPNYGAIFQIPTLSGDSPIQLGRPHNARRIHEIAWKYRQSMNVKFHLSPGMELEGTEPAFTSGRASLRWVIDNLPLIWAVRDYRVASSEAEVLELMGDAQFHPGDYVILEDHLTGLSRVLPGARPHTELASLGPLRKIIKTRSDQPGLLVIAENFHPGWQALLDGQPTTIYRANYTAQALYLPSGEHVFTLLYLPSSLIAGAGISGLTIVLLVFWGWRKRVLHKKIH